MTSRGTTIGPLRPSSSSSSRRPSSSRHDFLAPDEDNYTQLTAHSEGGGTRAALSATLSLPPQSMRPERGRMASENVQVFYEVGEES
jgi:hypothetical protein